MRLSVVVPCYNEQQGVGELHRRVSAACAATVGESYEIVLINDGSRDATWPAMLAQAAQDAHLVCINLSRNHGHQLALTAGLQFCRGERIFILDADLQDPPELLPEMMRRMDGGCDVVYGQRVKRTGEGWFKQLAALVFYRILNRLVDIEIPVDTGDFRLMSRRALETLNGMPEHHRFIRGMVSWIGLRQEPLRYERAPRFAGETKYPLAKMLRLAFDAITSFSVRPLRVASYLGIAVGFFALLMLVYVFVRWIHGNTVEGWASVMAALLVIGSGQLFVAGVMGEYLGRLYIESKHRPLFVIQDVVRNGSPPSTVVQPTVGSDNEG